MRRAEVCLRAALVVPRRGRRLALAALTVALGLLCAGSAVAGIDAVAVTDHFSGHPGSRTRPAPLGVQQSLQLTSLTSGSRTGVVHRLTFGIADARLDTAGASICTAAKLRGHPGPHACPRTALLATGSLTLTLGSAADLMQAGAQCTPRVEIFAGGPGRLRILPIETGSHQCLAGLVRTGGIPAWTGSYRELGFGLQVTLPIPDSIDYPLGVDGGEIGSLSAVQLDWTSPLAGTRHDIQSTGCMGTRGYALALQVSLPGERDETRSVSGSSACG